MKKIILALLLCVAMVAVLASCGEEPPQPPVNCEHTFDAGVVTTAATCTADGVKTLTCTKCGQTSTSVIPATGEHQYDAGTVTTAATCAADGVKTLTCTVCGNTKTETIAATGEHTYVLKTVIKDATCADGLGDYACSVCGDEKTQAIPAVAQHNWQDTVVKAATLEAAGIGKKVCSVCSASGEEYEIPKMNVDALKPGWDEEWAHRFDFIEDQTLRASIEEFYGFYDPEKLTKWAAHLYDPTTGGFYYANSSRDTEGYLPDMESTYQVTNWIRNYGFLQAYTAGGVSENDALRAFYGSEMCQAIIDFYNNCEDESDGYFYHPQFGKGGNLMRKSRDLSWAKNMFEWLGGKAKYPTALERLAANSGIGGMIVPLASEKTYLNDKDLAKAYTENLIASSTFEGWSNTLQTQSAQFKAGGVLDTVLDVLDSVSDPESGIWGVKSTLEKGVSYISTRDIQETAYSTFTLTYKIAIMYNDGARLMPHAAALTRNAIATITSDVPSSRYTYIHNPWATLNNVRSNLQKYGTAADLAEFDAIVKESALDMLASLKAQFNFFSHDDSSISFYRYVSASEIYSTPISLGLPEGDVNATNLSLGTLGAVCNVLGLDHRPAIFDYRHGELFKAEIANLQPIKKQKLSLTPRSFDFEDGALGEGYMVPGVNAQPDASNPTRFYIVEDPTNAQNKVFKFEKKTNSGRSLTFNLLDSMSMTDESILQVKFKMYFDSNLHMDPPNAYTGMQQVRFGSGSTFFYMICFVFDDMNNPTGIKYTDMAHTSSGREVCEDKLFAFDTWYEFTLDFDIKGFGNGTPTFNSVKVYANDELFYTSTNHYQNGYQNDDHAFYFDNKKITAVFAPQMRCYGDVLLDDLSMVLETPTAE